MSVQWDSRGRRPVELMARIRGGRMPVTGGRLAAAKEGRIQRKARMSDIPSATPLRAAAP